MAGSPFCLRQFGSSNPPRLLERCQGADQALSQLSLNMELTLFGLNTDQQVGCISSIDKALRLRVAGHKGIHDLGTEQSHEPVDKFN